MSDAELVAHAREWIAAGEAGIETAKRCVALVFERHRGLVRAICAAKAPIDDVDDLESDVYERFVRVVYLRRTPIEAPAGLLVVMARRVVASYHDRRKPAGVPLDEAGRGRGRRGRLRPGGGGRGWPSSCSRRSRTGSARWCGRGCGRTSRAPRSRQRMDTTPGNVDVIFFRAMRRLREELER